MKNLKNGSRPRRTEKNVANTGISPRIVARPRTAALVSIPQSQHLHPCSVWRINHPLARRPAGARPAPPFESACHHGFELANRRIGLPELRMRPSCASDRLVARFRPPTDPSDGSVTDKRLVIASEPSEPIVQAWPARKLVGNVAVGMGLSS